MKRASKWSSGLAGFALLCLVSWSAQAEPDKPCKGKDCFGAKVAKTPARAAAKPSKSTAANRKVSGVDGASRPNKSLGANKLLPAVEPAAGAGRGAGNAAAGKNAKTPAGSEGKVIAPMFEKK